jgi:hypothetical protein
MHITYDEPNQCAAQVIRYRRLCMHVIVLTTISHIL